MFDGRDSPCNCGNCPTRPCRYGNDREEETRIIRSPSTQSLTRPPGPPLPSLVGDLGGRGMDSSPQPQDPPQFRVSVSETGAVDTSRSISATKGTSSAPMVAWAPPCAQGETSKGEIRQATSPAEATSERSPTPPVPRLNAEKEWSTRSSTRKLPSSTPLRRSSLASSLGEPWMSQNLGSYRPRTPSVSSMGRHASCSSPRRSSNLAAGPEPARRSSASANVSPSTFDFLRFSTLAPDASCAICGEITESRKLKACGHRVCKTCLGRGLERKRGLTRGAREYWDGKCAVCGKGILEF
ncbi:hypothetical protein K505DRAFT_336905 [Melanomma pulvis-pyrius CBS 109.77]|uniref:RING-type domain-containing protein n=1 Tax=Melanomma pulvis-pyrius CBS 109.77 TaxID=1314802 RepID=A0A6A6XEI6_9PLEO|nr:hypothetical protein K505DRAFT_336905 [Melanomma pulvis-pyrius CBS 109.77]